VAKNKGHSEKTQPRIIERGDDTVEKAGLNGLNEGQVVEYEEVPNKGKTSAGHLKLQR
jgi:hypothetical protein